MLLNQSVQKINGTFFDDSVYALAAMHKCQSPKQVQGPDSNSLSISYWTTNDPPFNIIFVQHRQGAPRNGGKVLNIQLESDSYIKIVLSVSNLLHRFLQQLWTILIKKKSLQQLKCSNVYQFLLYLTILLIFVCLFAQFVSFMDVVSLVFI